MGITPGAWIVLFSVGSGGAASGEAPESALVPHPTLAPLDPAPPAAVRGGFEAREGFYLGLHGTWAQLDRDFDGETVLVGADETIAIPDADDGAGLGLAIGHRWERNALELDVSVIQHDGTLPGGVPGGDVTYTAVDANWRYFFRHDRHLQPFVQATLGLAFASLEDASADNLTAEIGDADLAGVELGLGGGLEYYLSERWSFGVRVAYRQTYFDSAEGVTGDEGDIDDTIEARGVTVAFGTAFTF